MRVVYIHLLLVRGLAILVELVIQQNDIVIFGGPSLIIVCTFHIHHYFREHYCERMKRAIRHNACRLQLALYYYRTTGNIHFGCFETFHIPVVKQCLCFYLNILIVHVDVLRLIRLFTLISSSLVN